jgi:hypothetical protein
MRPCRLGLLGCCRRTMHSGRGRAGGCLGGLESQSIVLKPSSQLPQARCGCACDIIGEGASRALSFSHAGCQRLYLLTIAPAPQRAQARLIPAALPHLEPSSAPVLARSTRGSASAAPSGSAGPSRAVERAHSSRLWRPLRRWRLPLTSRTQPCAPSVTPMAPIAPAAPVCPGRQTLRPPPHLRNERPPIQGQLALRQCLRQSS